MLQRQFVSLCVSVFLSVPYSETVWNKDFWSKNWDFFGDDHDDDDTSNNSIVNNNTNNNYENDNYNKIFF